MTILRLLNAQGIAGIAISLCVGILLIFQKAETGHWKKQSGQYEQLYRDEQSAFAGTVANFRAAADQARATDEANAKRVAGEQHAINERTQNAFDTRVADARARAERLRLKAKAVGTDSSSSGSAPMPRLSAAAGVTNEAAGQDRLPAADALTATEQAIQLDELINWVKAQAAVDPNGKASRSD
jgi:hypothetical protein